MDTEGTWQEAGRVPGMVPCQTLMLAVLWLEALLLRNMRTSLVCGVCGSRSRNTSCEMSLPHPK